MVDKTPHTFKLTVRVAASLVPYFQSKKIKLCASFGVDTNITEERFNVIATSDGKCLLLPTRHREAVSI